MISDQPPLILTKLEAFVQNKYQRNISLGFPNKDEMSLAKYFCLQKELIHNIPRDINLNVAVGSKSLNEIYVWKPNKTEKDFFFILHQFLISSESIMIYYQEVHEFERFVAHYVADSIGLEHKSIDTPQGRRLTFWKTEMSSFSSFTNESFHHDEKHEEISLGYNLEQNREPLSDEPTGLSRSETWTPNSPLPNFENDFDIEDGVDESQELFDTCPPPPSPITASSTSISSLSSNSTTSSAPKWIDTMSGETTSDSFENFPEGSPLARQLSRRVINEIKALKENVNQLSEFERITTGTGEVYLVRDNGTGGRAIFKPAAQVAQSRRTTQPISESHSKSFSEDDEGEDEISTHRKEVAAYQLDHFGFAGVLPTIQSEVKLSADSSLGMIQQYLDHDKTADEDVIGLNEIHQLNVRDVHMVGLLDIRLFNEDRHGGNLLLDQKEGQPTRLVPIDHELTLPHWRHLQNATFCWMTWKQASKPFDEETLDYVRKLDIDHDIFLLRQLSIPTSSIATYTICCNFLKICTSYGLNLREMANIMVRFPDYPYHDKFGPLQTRDEEGGDGLDEEEPSTLEKLISLAKQTQNDHNIVGLQGTTTTTDCSDDDCFGNVEISRFKILLKNYLSAMLADRHGEIPPQGTEEKEEQWFPPSPSAPPPPISHLSSALDVTRSLEGLPLQKVTAFS